jgi:hypothetical protein
VVDPLPEGAELARFQACLHGGVERRVGGVLHLVRQLVHGRLHPLNRLLDRLRLCGVARWLAAWECTGTPL